MTTREQATKILKQLAQRAYCGETITPTLEEVEALFEGVKALERLERANAPEVNMPHYDRYKQERPETEKTWISAAEITKEIKRIVEETVAAECREVRRLLEMTRDIVEAEKEFTNSLIEAAASTRRKGET